jgi:uncharacterized protein
MRIAITGATGLVGGELTRQLRAAGHEITPVTRRPDGIAGAVGWDPARGTIDAAGLEGHDVAIHLAGESLAGVWTPAKKRRIRESRVQGTSLLAATLAQLAAPPRVLFSASGFNIYGDRGDEIVDEASPPGTGFLADVARAWEASTGAAQEAGIREVHMRFGTVLSPEGGMLGTLLPLFRIGLGGRLGSGEQVWPWIALADIPPALMHVLERPEIAGPVNFVAPEQVTNREFTDTLAHVLGRPAFMRAPGFAVQLAPGGMGNELLLSGVRVRPGKLLDSGYEYRWPQLEPALRAMLADRATSRAG